MAAPAMSSATPMRPPGMRGVTWSAWSRAVRFMSEAKAPGAMALTAMRSGARRSAMRRVRCTSPALLAAYE